MKKKLIKIEKYLIDSPGILVMITIVYLGVIVLFMNKVEVVCNGEIVSLWNRVIEQIMIGDI